MGRGLRTIVLALSGALLQLVGLIALLSVLLTGIGDGSVLAAGGGGGLLLLLFGATTLVRAARGAGPAEAPAPVQRDLGPGVGAHELLPSEPGATPAPDGATRGRFGRWGPLPPLLLFLVALVVGTMALAGGGELLGLLPLAHFAAALLPAWAVVALVARRGGGARGGTVLASLGWGGLGATSIALVAEVGFGLLLALALLGALRLEGGGAAEALLAAARQALEGGDETALLAAARELALRPAALLAAYGLFALLGPAVEELAKVAGLALAGPTSRRGALLRGVAIGAGFGLTEAVLIGASTAAGSPSLPAAGPEMAAVAGVAWPVGMMARAVTTLMHATLTGLAALGWHALQAEGRWAAGAGRVGLAILLHALWNGLALTAVLGSLALLGPEGVPVADPDPLRAAIPIVATGALVVLAWGIILTLVGLARRSGRAR